MSEDVKATPEISEQQRSADSWPVPGDEGYVVPDGTPQAAQQLEDNKRAAADRAAAGVAMVGGWPAATPGPQMEQQQAAAQQRQDAYSGPTTDERDAGVADSITAGFDTATEKAENSDQPVTPSAVPAPDGTGKRTAEDSKSTTKR